MINPSDPVIEEGSLGTQSMSPRNSPSGRLVDRSARAVFISALLTGQMISQATSPGTVSFAEAQISRMSEISRKMTDVPSRTFGAISVTEADVSFENVYEINTERHRLIDKKYSQGLSDGEVERLERLNRFMINYQDVVAPMPSEELAKVKRLLGLDGDLEG